MPEAQQAGAIPYRRESDSCQVCLITTLSSGKWSIPKGFIDPGDSARETAAREAEEEAGLHGRVVGGPVGYYDITKYGDTYTVAVYLLEVEQVDDEWDEQAVRQRKWTSTEVAARLLDGRPVSEVFDRAVALLGRALGPSEQEKAR